MPSGTLHAYRSFLTPDSLDSIRTELEGDEWNAELGEDEVPIYSAGFYLSEEGNGHYCCYSTDLQHVKHAAQQIILALSDLVGKIEAIPVSVTVSTKTGGEAATGDLTSGDGAWTGADEEDDNA